MLHTYDHHERMYRLTVQSDQLRERYGMVSIPGEWRISSEEREPEIASTNRR
jgi:hypothetical protein